MPSSQPKRSTRALDKLRFLKDPKFSLKAGNEGSGIHPSILNNLNNNNNNFNNNNNNLIDLNNNNNINNLPAKSNY